jgi:putative zinc finger protein
MDCLAVRDRLAEHALSTLPADERVWVSRHLDWCAGCRKEAGELVRAATGLGLRLDPAEPPRDLEDRVVEAVATAAGRRVPRRRRLIASALVAATFVAVAGLGFGTYMAGRAQEAEADRLAAEEAADRARRDEQRIARDLERVLRELRESGLIGSGARMVSLAPARAGIEGGGAAVIVDNERQHFAVVLVAGLEPARRYRALLFTDDGDLLGAGIVGSLDPAAGSGERVIDATGSLEEVTRVVVRDLRGRDVLKGSVAEPTPSPSVTGSG